MTQQAKDDLANILRRIAAGDPISGAEPEEHESERKPHIPQHLKDLAPEDLPESHRNNTLSSIAQFREAAVKKAHQRFEIDRQIEERRQAMIAQNARQHQQRAAPALSPPGPSAAAGPSQDPQSFNRPVAFVSGGAGANGASAPQPEPELDDMERERERAEAEHRQQEAVYRNVGCSSALSSNSSLIAVLDSVSDSSSSGNERESPRGSGSRPASKASPSRRSEIAHTWRSVLRPGTTFARQSEGASCSMSTGA